MPIRAEEVEFLTETDVVEIHERVLAAHGGLAGVLKPNELSSAVLAPQASYGKTLLLRSLADIASGYAFYLARSHPFVDGNKRTALASAATFLALNGYELELDERWVELMVRLASDRVFSREELAEFFASAMGDWGPIE